MCFLLVLPFYLLSFSFLFLCLSPSPPPTLLLLLLPLLAAQGQGQGRSAARRGKGKGARRGAEGAMGGRSVGQLSLTIAQRQRHWAAWKPWPRPLPAPTAIHIAHHMASRALPGGRGAGSRQAAGAMGVALPVRPSIAPTAAPDGKRPAGRSALARVSAVALRRLSGNCASLVPPPPTPLLVCNLLTCPPSSGSWASH